jgi:hypothetical protein
MFKIVGIPFAIRTAVPITSEIFGLTWGSVRIRTFSLEATTATSSIRVLAALDKSVILTKNLPGEFAKNIQPPSARRSLSQIISSAPPKKILFGSLPDSFSLRSLQSILFYFFMVSTIFKNFSLISVLGSGFLLQVLHFHEIGGEGVHPFVHDGYLSAFSFKHPDLLLGAKKRPQFEFL